MTITAKMSPHELLALCQEAIAADLTLAAWHGSQPLTARRRWPPLSLSEALSEALKKLDAATGRAATVSQRGVLLRGQVAYDLLSETYGVVLDLDERLGLPRAVWAAGTLRVVALNVDARPEAQRPELQAVSACFDRVVG